MTSKLWPVPEILEGEESFTLIESKGNRIPVCTDLVGKIMQVPTGDDAFGRMGRMHEMAHVAITPKEGMQQAQEEGIGSEYINVAEDMRVNIFLNRRFKLEKSIPKELFLHRLKGYVLEDNLREAILMAVACKNIPEYGTLLEFFQDEKPDWGWPIRDVVDICENFFYPPTFEASMECARYLQGNYNPEAMATRKAIDKAIEEGDDIPDSIANFLKGSYEDAPDLEWGKMEIIRPALVEHLGERRLTRRIKPQEMGASMMFPSRLDVDDKIFASIKRVSKGTVLIDVSGSMQMTAEDIKAMIHQAPGVTVACYSGNGDGAGHLTIVAAKGAMAELPYGWPGANEVDGPALEWLAKQAEPRVWVCDGNVTGVGDKASKKLTLEAFDIVKRNKIRRTGEIENAPALLKK